MDKRQLQTYSVWAKENLERQIEVSLKTLGIHGDKEISRARRVGDFTVIEGDANSYPASLLGKRNRIVELVREKGFQNVIEEFAYTWFNRLVALRYMEIHGFLPHGFRVLSDPGGGVEPEILKNLSLVRTELRLDPEVYEPLKAQSRTEELYRYVLLRQCGALADILPMLFERDNDYLELLLPKSLLIGDTVLTRLLEIPEDAFLEEVEIIGWMYQFYISAKKTAVNKEREKSKKPINKDTLPAVTQLFTPKWIVRYMAENSLGRIWLESNPASPLRNEMRYYVEEAEQTEEVRRHLEAIRYRNVDPKELRIIDPCCGSGHILVYVFDLLYRMYEEKGYAAREIPTLILKHNLVGLDVDKRAAQLASFALVMKARSRNSRFFGEGYYVNPRVLELRDSSYLIAIRYRQQMEGLSFSEEEIKAAETLVETFRHGKTLGSLIMVPSLNIGVLETVLQKLEHEVVETTFNAEFVKHGAALLRALLDQARALAARYDVMITNPPYLGTSAMEPAVKDYAVKHYPNSKADLFAMFMETGFVKPNGFTAMINMHSWMFLASFENFRQFLLRSRSFLSMVHLGPHAFESVTGEIVQTTSFVFRSVTVDFNTVFIRLVNSRDKEKAFDNDIYRIIYQTSSFNVIPGSPFVYWLPDNLVKAFELDTIGKHAISDGQTKTGNNDRFLRFLWEVSSLTIGRDRKWVLHAKGGTFRRWYGNIDTVIDWSESARNHYRADRVARIAPEYIWFREGICWNLITNNERFAARILTDDSTFNLAAPSIFFNDAKLTLYALGLLNSYVAERIIRALNPTLNTNVGDIMNQPLIHPDNPERSLVTTSTVQKCIQLCKTDWDAFETSWDFQYHPMLLLLRDKADAECTQFAKTRMETLGSLEWHYSRWADECRSRFDTLKANEEELNRIFIDIYGLQDELTPEVKDEDVTVRLADKERDIRSLISYLVGVVMGRYSLDVPGLAYAGGDWDASKYVTYQPDDDGIVPIYVGLGMEDGMTARIIRLLKLIYGEDSYRANIDFIADALGKKNSESSEEALNRYLNEGFYPDHLKIYQKRPIYWLFSSGKHGGFKCLIYMHRYNEDTLARINGRYFLPESTRLKNELEELRLRIARTEDRDRVRLEKERQKLAAAYDEALEYGQVLDHMANKYIPLDLDDGVKVNYAKFQGVELVTDSGTKMKKDLLSPIK